LTVLADLSFRVPAGQTVAVVGASGSGKSTLLGLLAGLDLPTEGSVTMFGESLFALDEDGRAAWRARHLGFVFQSFQLLPQMTALENVRSEEHTSELQSRENLVCRLLLEQKKGAARGRADACSTLPPLR